MAKNGLCDLCILTVSCFWVDDDASLGKQVRPKRRSIGRFIGLGQNSGDQVVYKGGIDQLQPGQFSGWVVSEEVSLLEVRLLLGEHLIAKGEINQQRPDVNAKLGWQGAAGFCVELPTALPMLNWQESPRVIALSADGSKHVELGLLGRKNQTGDLLKKLLQSDLLGLIGHVDGLVQGALRGWACRSNQTIPAKIWLQSDGQKPIPVSCDLYREGMQSLRLPWQCGFAVEPQSLPEGWAGVEVWCSFDQGGEYRIPQETPVVLPGARSKTISINSEMESWPEPKITQTTNIHTDMDTNITEDLAEHWQRLEEFRCLLDLAEQRLIQSQQAKATGTKKFQSRFSRLLRLPAWKKSGNSS
jgi:hypothetical protein